MTEGIEVSKGKSGITFPAPKGAKGKPFGGQDVKRRPVAPAARVIPRTKASAKGR
jgi:hypothetical protein